MRILRMISPYSMLFPKGPLLGPPHYRVFRLLPLTEGRYTSKEGGVRLPEGRRIRGAGCCDHLPVTGQTAVVSYYFLFSAIFSFSSFFSSEYIFSAGFSSPISGYSIVRGAKKKSLGLWIKKFQR